jgi:hypothetical protein
VVKLGLSVSLKSNIESMDAVHRAGPEQQGAIAQLLRLVFGPGMSPSLLNPELLQWKFFSPRPGSNGSRSYVLGESAEIQAHACEWPISFLSSSHEVQSCHLIDWAARPEAKGAGIRIYQYLMAQNDTVLAIGGSVQARKLLPKLGFRPHGTLDSFARVVRPWRQYCTRPQRTGWRGLARLARNTIWSLPPVAVSEGEWTAAPVSHPNDLPDKAFRIHASSFCLGVRSPAWLQYLLDCPIMNCRLFALAKASLPRGYFLLNQVAGQCRIVDLAVDSEAPLDWEAAYRVAVTTAVRQKTTCEVTAVSSLPWLSEAFRKIGFRLRQQIPVMLHDPARRLVDSPPLHLRMTDSDHCFLYDEAYPYLT